MATWESAFRKEILAKIADYFAQNNIPTTSIADGSLNTPTDLKMGHLAYPCFPLAKSLKKSPNAIAQDMAASIKTDKGSQILKAEAAGGYVNFFLNTAVASKKFIADVQSGAYFSEITSPKEQIDVEYSQPNTHKALHLGHMRNLFYGDAVCNLLERIGHKIIRTTYPGDLGAHIAKVLWYLKQIPRSTWPKEHQATWVGKQYAIASQALEALDEKAKDKAVIDIQQILANLQDEKGDDHKLYLETRQWSLDEMKREYEWAGSNFTRWYYESECDVPSRELVQNEYKKGTFIMSDGAIGAQLGDDLGFALLLKKDGNGLYLTKDLELMRRKFSDPKTARAIYIVDSRQKLHFKQLFQVAELMGFPQAARSEHLSYESVTNETGEAFSSRDARGLALEELRAQIDDIVRREYLERHRSEWKEDEIHTAAEKITLASLKYGMLRVDPLSPIKFIQSQWIALEGETGPYLQYAYTRCQSILQKAAGWKMPVELHITAFQEEELFLTLYRYNEIVERAALDYRPNHLANYLFDIGKSFNRFYKECPVLTADAASKDSRLALVYLTQKFIEDACRLLNIPLIARM